MSRNDCDHEWGWYADTPEGAPPADLYCVQCGVNANVILASETFDSLRAARHPEASPTEREYRSVRPAMWVTKGSAVPGLLEPGTIQLLDPDQEPDNGYRRGAEERPEIICICGSSRFIDQMAVMAWELEKGGAIALSLHLLPASYPGLAAHHQAEAEGIAAQMDELHLRKIDLSDRVLVMNVGGYIGESTRREIAYATKLGKPIRYLEENTDLAFGSLDPGTLPEADSDDGTRTTRQGEAT